VTTDPVTSGAPASELATPKKDDLGKTAFLSLLVTQLQHQDPLDPQDNSEFLAQLAQFSSLESLQQVQDSTSQMATDLAALRSLLGGGVSDGASGPSSAGGV
jgi:flagellar basal-body rod modification protein FlgD